MTRDEAKAEAEKIVEMFQVIELSPEGDICVTFKTQEIEVAKKCAIIHVKGIIESNPSSPIPDGYYELLQDRIDYATGHWRSILTELNNM